MNDKVKELVDRLARRMALYKYGGTEERLYPHWVRHATCEVEDILSQEPDLALIDLQQFKNWLIFIDNELCFGGNWEDTKEKIKELQQLVIPLAGALKESEDGKD